MNKKIVVSSLFLILSACHNLSDTPNLLPREGGNNYYSIDLDIKNVSSISMDSMVRDVKFVTLETSEDCLIGSYDKIIVLKDTIYILDKTHQKAVFAFDIQGSFLYKISALGRGPGEYARAYDFYVDTVNSHIGVLDYGKVQKYNFEGEHIGQVSFLGSGAAYLCYNAGKYNGFTFEKFTKDRSYVFAQFDTVGNLVYRDHPTPNVMIESELRKSDYFTSNKEGAYFNDFGSDTIYRITDAFLAPAFVLDYGNSALPLNVRTQLMKKPFLERYSFFEQNKHIVSFGLENMSMSDDYLLLGVPYGKRLKRALFSLNTHTVKFLETGNMHNSILRPENILLSGEYFVGTIKSHYVHSLNKWDYDDLNITERETDHPFFYQNVDGYAAINDMDNAIICLFSFDEF